MSGLTPKILLPPQTRPRSRSPLTRFLPRPRRRLDFPLRHRRRIFVPPYPNRPLAIHPPQRYRTRLHLPRRGRPRRARPARIRLLSESDLDESSPRTGQPGTAQTLARSLRRRKRVATIVRRARPRFDVKVDVGGLSFRRRVQKNCCCRSYNHRGNAGCGICRRTTPASSMTRRDAASIEYESE